MHDPEDDRRRLLEIVRERALRTFDEPRELASGELSRDFIDAKAGLARGADLRLACSVIAGSVAAAGIEWDAVGGLTLGADQFAHGVVAALDDDHEWFVVRKQPKGRGTDQLVEGASLGAGTRVLLVDDIVTTGGSIQVAHQRVLDTGADRRGGGDPGGPQRHRGGVLRGTRRGVPAGVHLPRPGHRGRRRELSRRRAVRRALRTTSGGGPLGSGCRGPSPDP